MNIFQFLPSDGVAPVTKGLATWKDLPTSVDVAHPRGCRTRTPETLSSFPLVWDAQPHEMRCQGVSRPENWPVIIHLPPDTSRSLAVFFLSVINPKVVPNAK